MTSQRPRLWHVVLLAFALNTASAADVAGFTQPSRDVDISAADTGPIVAVEVREGDAVEKGQVLARTDAAVLQVSRRMAEAQVEAEGKLNRARAELRMQTERLEKLRGLLARKHAGQEEFDRAELDRAMAAASLQTAEEEQRVRRLERDRIDAQIEERTVRATLSGTVVQVFKEVGEFVSPADAVVMRVVRLDPLTAVFPLPERMLGEVEPGGEATVSFPRTGTTVTGRVEFVSPVVDPKSGTVRVKVTLANPDGRLRAGERCDLRVEGVDDGYAEAVDEVAGL